MKNFMEIECPVCKCNSFICKRDNGITKIGECSSCTLAFMHPFIQGNVDDVGKTHSSKTSSDYYENILKNFDAQKKLAQIKAPEMLSLWSALLGKSPSSILEIGCGTGQYYQAWSQLGISWQGVEVNRDMIDRCQSMDMPVQHFDDHHEDADKYDIIFMSQVLEHVLEPYCFLDKIKTYMHDDTILHLDVPNHNSITSLVRKIFKHKTDYGFIQPNHHQIAYTEKSLNILLGQSNLDVLDLHVYSNDHPIFGQLLVKKPFLNRIQFKISNYTNKGSLLVALAKLKQMVDDN